MPIPERLKTPLKRSVATLTLKPVETRRILLTFDDGPDPVQTPRVLDILQSARARAVFFVIGERAARFPDVVRQIKESGHAIGNHSHTHARVWNPADAYREVELCQRAVMNIAEVRPRLYRPPRGKLTSLTAWYALSRGMKLILWSVDPKDYKIKVADEAKRKGAALGQELAQRTHVSDIVLLHDASPCGDQFLEKLLANLSDFDLSTGVDCI